jgi:hypothetical protein
VDRLLEEVEDESERCCQYCGKHSYQIWIDRWRIIHLCRKHTLVWFLTLFLYKLKSKFWKAGCHKEQ